MGNNGSRERRHTSAAGDSNSQRTASGSGTQDPGTDHPGTGSHASRSTRGTRIDASLFGLGSSSQQDGLEGRRETKQEREARRLERERIARLKERERSMRDEHVDGGYLVTQGVYTGTEDFNKEIVRQLMIMRCIAPFWRGLEDFNSGWTEYQLVAAAKGLPIPAPDEIPPELEAPAVTQAAGPLTANAPNTTLPIAGRTDTVESTGSGNVPYTLSSNQHNQTSSPFRPRSKTIASLTSKSPSQSEMVPREIQLPVDPYVNGLRMEAFLYKDAIECPICFIYYPPYLNQTRCCDQPICSECFVQIKRPDPHPPEHQDPSNPSSPPPSENTETLVSEPANCPYCQQAEFGVTYDPPPFRRGLAYANMGAQGSPMAASDSSPNNGSSSSLRPAGSRRRATSVSANASNVVTTDKIRPDWATKLATARNHAQRRSAAATALHTAAYLMNGTGLEARGFGGFGNRSRFGRSRDSPGESSTGERGGANVPSALDLFPHLAAHHAEREGQEAPQGRRRSRMDDLEDMMMMEAIRLSIAAEEERKRKEEKENKKEAKRKEKEQKKADKAASKNGIYGASGSKSGSRTASALSLVLPGRRRGNSGSSAMAREAAAHPTDHTFPPDSNDKGKGVERGSASTTSAHPSGLDGPTPSSLQSYGQHLGDQHTAPPSTGPSPPASGNVNVPDRPSHLRQISSASSPSSSYVESAPGSIRRGFQASTSTLDSPNASNTNLSTGQGRDRDGDEEGAGDEPMFNFRSLAEIVGKEDEKDGYGPANQVEYADENARPVSQSGPANSDGGEGSSGANANHNPFDDSEENMMDQSVATIRADDQGYERVDEQMQNGSTNSGLAVQSTPEVMVTASTPAPLNDAESEGKQLGH